MCCENHLDSYYSLSNFFEPPCEVLSRVDVDNGRVDFLGSSKSSAAKGLAFGTLHDHEEPNAVRLWLLLVAIKEVFLLLAKSDGFLQAFLSGWSHEVRTRPPLHSFMNASRAEHAAHYCYQGLPTTYDS